MLPSMSNTKRNLIAGTVALALMAASAAPALAWGDREQGFTTGVLSTLFVEGMIKASRNQPVYNRPTYQQPYYQQPTYYEPTYRQPTYRQPTYYQPAPVYQQPVYSNPIASAFNSYSRNERVRIQATLTNYGYYNGRLDGAFGQGTLQALTNYAHRTGKSGMLNSRGGAYGLMDGLLS